MHLQGDVTDLASTTVSCAFVHCSTHIESPDSQNLETVTLSTLLTGTLLITFQNEVLGWVNHYSSQQRKTLLPQVVLRLQVVVEQYLSNEASVTVTVSTQTSYV